LSLRFSWVAPRGCACPACLIPQQTTRGRVTRVGLIEPQKEAIDVSQVARRAVEKKTVLEVLFV
jgi:hypothetical protein